MAKMDILPQNFEAEINVLGAILIDNNMLANIIEILKSEDFYSSANKLIYKTMLSMYKRDLPIDTTTLVNEFGWDKVKAIGGASYILKIQDSVPSTANVVSYAEIVKKMSDRRLIIKTCREAVDKAYDEEPSKIIDGMESNFLNIGNKNADKILKDDELMELTLNKIESNYKLGREITGITTGYKKLDAAMNGLNKGDLIIIAGRPSMGKTAFGLSLASGIAKLNKIAVFELEMSAEKLAMRRLSALTRINSNKLSRGKINDDQWGILVNKACKEADRNNIFTDDSAGLTIQQIKSKAKQIKLKYGLDAVIIDHLQLIEALEPRQPLSQQVSQITRQAKKMAKELDISVIMLSQLSRMPEQRRDHRPLLSDLRDSGSIEQDADVVMFLYRDEYYDPESQDKGIMECIIAKQRDGSTGKLQFAYEKECQVITEI